MRLKIPFLQRFFNSRASPTNDFFSGFLYGSGMSGSGKAVNERTQLTGVSSQQLMEQLVYFGAPLRSI